jgi:hypothetical protein
MIQASESFPSSANLLNQKYRWNGNSSTVPIEILEKEGGRRMERGRQEE